MANGMVSGQIAVQGPTLRDSKAERPEDGQVQVQAQVQAQAQAQAQARLDAALLRLIPRGATRVVEIGSGFGLQGASHKSLNPNSIYEGIDDRAEVRALAERRLDKIEIKRFDEAEIPAGADCVVYNHALECMRDPLDSLKRQTAALSADAVVVAAILNVQAADTVMNLLAGAWPAAGKAANRRQIRHFNRQGIIQLFRDAGLAIHDMHEEPVEAETAEKAEKLKPLLAGLGLDQPGAGPRLAVRRFILRAGRRPLQPILLHNATLVPGPGQSQVIEIRVRQPMEFLASYPGIEVQRESFRDLAPRQRPDGMAKICILQRIILSRGGGAKLVRQLLKAGYLVVAEWDDDPDHWPAIAENGHIALKGVHALQVSTEPLAAKVSQFNPEVAVFPNQTAALPPLRDLERPGPVTFFFGAMNREKDWAPYMTTLNEVLGGREDVSVQVVHDKRFFDALTTERKTFTPNTPTEDYYRLLGQADISFMPLADTPFNRLKSDLKFIEAAARGAAALASPVIYSGSVEDGRTGLIFRDATELKAKLLALIEQPDLRRSLARNAHAYVRAQRMLSQHVPLRLKWYRTLLQHKDWLDQALRQRCPEVFAD